MGPVVVMVRPSFRNLRLAACRCDCNLFITVYYCLICYYGLRRRFLSIHAQAPRRQRVSARPRANRGRSATHDRRAPGPFVPPPPRTTRRTRPWVLSTAAPPRRGTAAPPSAASPDP